VLNAPHVSFLGHSTAVIEDSGVRLLTDPVLRGRIGHLRRHGTPVLDAAWSGVDGVLISHLHHDHFDRRSLELIDRRTPIVVPAGGGSLIRELGFGAVEEVVAGDRVGFGAVSVLVVHAEHEGGRGPRSTHKAQPVGYIVEGQRRSYFAGDTDIFDEMAAIGEPQLDLALIPVWGWGPTLGPGHLDPRSAADALALLAPTLAIPIHWGTLYPFALERLRPRALSDPPHLFKRYAGEIAPRSEVRILAPGETTEL
jgi:L-ascorbate metabolism protein UlaG (beta-lactamase superfamily)